MLLLGLNPFDMLEEMIMGPYCSRQNILNSVLFIKTMNNEHTTQSTIKWIPAVLFNKNAATLNE